MLKRQKFSSFLEEQFTVVQYEIIDFKTQLKNNAELKQKYKNTPWQDLLDENEECKTISYELFNKNSVVVCMLRFLLDNLDETFFTHFPIQYIIENLQKLFDHPFH